MLSDSLIPPNLHTLSDDVIGNVIPRSRTICMQETAIGDSILHHAMKSASAQIFIGKRRQMSTREVEQLIRVKAFNRERHRRYQEQYRVRQKKLKDDLEEHNQELREEIDKLTKQRQTLSRGISAKTAVWYVAVEYFRIFQRGLVSSDGAQDVALESLKTAMAPDLYAGTVYGFKSLVKSWKVFSSAFQDVRVELECVDQIAVNSLIAVTTTSITVSETSLSCMFPQLSARVAAKLLHQRLVLHGSVRFEWDRVNNCVASLITRADMMSPLLEVLGCLEDVSLVFTNARIQPDGNVVTED